LARMRKAGHDDFSFFLKARTDGSGAWPDTRVNTDIRPI
jgi:hypothetical protein